MAQPYVDKTPDIRDHMLELRFKICSQINVSGVQLALEQPGYATVLWDGNPVEQSVRGFFVDRAIKTIAMPEISAGEHELLLQVKFGAKSDLEWCYLLGDFGVSVQGTDAEIVAPQDTLGFDSIVHQGMPFYGGNVVYTIPFTCTEGEYRLHIPHFCATVLGVEVDGNDCGIIAYSPYETSLGHLTEGEHVLKVTMFGNRINSFGQVHMKDDALTFFGPDTWRTKGDRWTYEYRLKPQGIMAAPILLKKS